MRRASGPTVSLFPFLTVLLCASGTLIVLLIALSQHVRDDAAAAAAPDSPPPVEPIQEPPATPPAPRPPRVVVRPSPEPDLRPAWRGRLAAAEAEADRVAAELGRADAAIRTASAGLDADEAEANRLRSVLRTASAERAAAVRTATGIRADAARVAAEAEGLRARAEAAAATPAPEAELLPVVRTAGGADVAAPVLIECAAAGATFRPADVTVPPSLIPPAADGSSVPAAGVRALTANLAAGDEYVLLLVRPDGLPAFYAAASALGAANVRYGYELLDADAKVAWGERDPAARSRLIASVERAATNRTRAVVRGFGSADGTGSGAVPGGLAAMTGDAPGRSAGGRGPAAGGPGGPGRSPAGLGSRGSAFGGEAGADGSEASGDADRAVAGDPFAPAARGRSIPGFTPGTPADRLSVGPTVRGAASGAMSGGRGPGAGGLGGPAGTAHGGGRSGPSSGGSRHEGGGAEQPDARPGLGAAATDSSLSPSAGSPAAGAAGGAAGSHTGRGGRADGGGGTSGSGEAVIKSMGRSADVTAIPAPSLNLGGREGSDGGGADDRIRFAVPVPATLSRGHLWVRGRWVRLPAGDQLTQGLADELNAVLDDRGAPPAGFRWAPEVRLNVRPDGAADVPAVRAALEELGAEVTTADAPPAAADRRRSRR